MWRDCNCQLDMEMTWKAAMKHFLGTRTFEDIVLKGKYEFESLLDPELWEAW